ncbi:hypothetical protein scyTo_0024086, partial [Scyliorhinus torazame]|nr:hypothetical protein [Scyliorhinus torazame]
RRFQTNPSQYYFSLERIVETEGAMLDRDLGLTPSYPPTYPEPAIGHTPYMSQPEYRIFELNKRLQNWTEVSLFHAARVVAVEGPPRLVPSPASAWIVAPTLPNVMLTGQSH